MANDAILEPHNQEIVGDELTTISFNYKWRKLVGELLTPLTYRSTWTGTQNDIDVAVDNAINLIIDLYNTEPTGMLTDLSSRVQLSAAIICPVSTWVMLTWQNGVSADTYNEGIYLPVSPSTNLVIPNGEDGIYLVHVQVDFTNFESGETKRQFRLRKNGVDFANKTHAPASGNQKLFCSGFQYFEEGDIITVEVHCNQEQQVYVNSGRWTYAAITKVAEI